MIEFRSFGNVEEAVRYIDQLVNQLQMEVGVKLGTGTSSTESMYGTYAAIPNGVKSYRISDNHNVTHTINIHVQENPVNSGKFNHYIHSSVELDGQQWEGLVKFDEGRSIRTLIFSDGDSKRELSDYFKDFPKHT